MLDGHDGNDPSRCSSMLVDVQQHLRRLKHRITAKQAQTNALDSFMMNLYFDWMAACAWAGAVRRSK
jgi:hypothetical protein